MNLTEILKFDDIFVRATGTMEQFGLGAEPTQVSVGDYEEIGQYCINNGTLAIIRENRSYWITDASEDVVEALEAAGYTRGSFYVPHSNDCGQGKKRLMASINRMAGLEKDLAALREAQSKLSPVKDISRYFKKATGTWEEFGIGSEPYELGRAQINEVGSFQTNNGTLAFVDADQNYWVGRPSEKAFQVLQKAGYSHGGLFVPHSNDCGKWMHSNFIE